MSRRRLLSVFLLLALATTAGARVISYAPYTDHASFTAMQNRMNRHFVLVEAAVQSNTGFGPMQPVTSGQLVVYDSRGEEAPRVVFPQDGSNANFLAAAARENGTGVVSMLVQAYTATATGTFPTFYLSTDGGSTWKTVGPSNTPVSQLMYTGPDSGGPFVLSRYSPVRIGNDAYPFVVLAGKLYAIAADGTSKVLYDQTSDPAQALAGSDIGGTQFLVRTASQYVIVDLNGTTRPIAPVTPQAVADGWITPDGGVYIEERLPNLTGRLLFAGKGAFTPILDTTWTDVRTPRVYMVPSSDYSSAWVVSRRAGTPTVLYKHTASAGLVKQWEDVTSADVEAVHAGSSGQKLLIQVHRPRPGVDQRQFLDPALAVWRVGDPAPTAYDELFMNEQWNKGFVHLDVEAIESGTPFVFDSGYAPFTNSPPPVLSPAPVGGGSDVSQEWGVVRGSLKQRLVLPSIGRVRGNFGSDWATDIVIQNSVDAPQNVTLTYLPTSDGTTAYAAVPPTTITLAPREIRLISDALKALFNIDNGTGAMWIDPEAGVVLTSRTYSKAANGTFGFGMNAIDALAAAASPRFPVTFAGAFGGTNFRTNMTITDTSGFGADAALTASGRDGAMGVESLTVTTAANGHRQFNALDFALGLLPNETGALRVQPNRGSAIAAVYSIDNRTNDATYFPPDLGASNAVRTIPAVGHVDGANGSKFRTDLFLYNPVNGTRTVTLQVKAWDTNDSPLSVSLTLLPREARVIRDVLATLFGRTGIARLRFATAGVSDSSGVRVTSRTYNVDPNGGTYGFLMPPLNNFQLGGTADTLEILGAIADPKYRINVGLVEMTQWTTNQPAMAKIEILDASGKTVDSFTTQFLSAGGTQINDIIAARSLKTSGPLLIRISPQSGVIGAYATMTDNGTNDSVYLAANLAAR